jgi:Kef-type K+ transport system membrane component KefB
VVPAQQLLTTCAAVAAVQLLFVCRHGRATFSVLLFQDLAVVVLLMLIPLLAPDPSGASTGMAKIAKVGFCSLA